MAVRRLVAYLCLAAAALLGVARAAEVDFNYADQSAWLNFPGSFCGGMRQSPINVLSNDVQVDRTLTSLAFSSGWDDSRGGTMFNKANTIRFDPSSSIVVTTGTPAGNYALQQFHFHWGPNAAVGSEHLVDGRAYSGELHFVHRKEPPGAADAGDAYAVVGVLLEADENLQLAGSSWERLTIPVAPGANASVSGVAYSDFLPAERGYYFYEGSLTTPLCNQVVQWFLLKEPVRAPAALFQRLRMVQTAAGTPLVLNYRETQPLNGRVVRTAGALSAAMASLWLTAVASLIGLMYV